ncbi:BRO-N domain-containing protein [Xenorhabdus ehlersii]|uniref:BRO family protein n=1 Tax=Xenorhabdus ehlersii TaxID=290111 RepID=A0A2D0IKR7_9GAMM|nr:Bro-N domain-containing protein [Xenorhabdus ehlersii]PHM22282.1 Rha family transcriptional regulator [Xenorhabdus ehlersii]RKE87854.1 BRO family protein [Xenorhabdus ehlersii]
MSTVLTFKEKEVIPFDNGDGKIWFTGKQVAQLLDYAKTKSVTNLYNANSDEFTPAMTEVTVVMTSKESITYRNLKTRVRIFSLRGLYLLGMLADTPVAKELRKWVLDLIEKESQPRDLSLMDMESLKELTIGEMQNRLVAANKWSFDNFGRKGSDLMNLRKRHLKKIRKAEKAILELSQLTLPGLDEFPDEGEPA